MDNKIVLGTLQFSGWFGKRQDKETIGLVRAFIEAGGYCIDMAPLYGFGKSEKLIGEALKPYDRKNYCLLTKGGFVDLENCTTVEEAKRTHKDTSYNALLKDFEASLERLQTDYIDAYFLHTRDGKTPLEESMSALNFLRNTKKVRFTGICNTTLEEVKSISKHCQIDFIQNRFSLINRSITSDFASYLLQNNIYLTPYRVIDYGLLASTSISNDPLSFDSSDLRNSKPDLQIDKQTLVLNWVKDYLAPIAHSLEITVAQLCIAWVLKQPYVSAPIIGITQEKHIVENLQSNSIHLPEKSVEQIEHAYQVLENIIWDEYRQPIHVFRGLNDRYY